MPCRQYQCQHGTRLGVVMSHCIPLPRCPPTQHCCKVPSWQMRASCIAVSTVASYARFHLTTGASLHCCHAIMASGAPLHCCLANLATAHCQVGTWSVEYANRPTLIFHTITYAYLTSRCICAYRWTTGPLPGPLGPRPKSRTSR